MFRKVENVVMVIVMLSGSAWIDLNKNGTVLKPHDMCPNQNCKCRKTDNLHSETV